MTLRPPTSRALALLALMIAPVLLAGCVSQDPVSSSSAPDAAADAPNASSNDWTRPLPEEIAGLETVGNAPGIEGAAGLWTDGDHAYVGGLSSGLVVVDLTTPTRPQVVGQVGDVYARDVDLLETGNRTVAVLAGSSEGMHLVDVTDPAAPAHLATVDVAPVHNVAVVPGTPYVYNSRSLDANQVVDVVDASDPTAPEVVHEVDFATTCHDVSFVPEADRAYCAAVEHTQIWNIRDPVHPELVSRIVNPLINIHHVVVPAHGGDLLLIGDEYAGSTAASTGCWANEDDPVRGGDASDPVGAFWVYDASDEANPTPLSWISPPAPTDNPPMTPCTAHFGTLVPDRDLLVAGWRLAGTHLVDFADPTAPRIVGSVQTGGNVWDARVHRGYVFTGDEGTGMDVLTFASAAS